MYIYSPEKILPERIKQAEAILKTIKAKHAFITGSFLYKKRYADIDLFIVTRSKKAFEIEDVDVHVIHPNRTSTLFYHSATKLCVSKSLLPKQKIRTTMSEYWGEINWCLTPLDGFDIKKETRALLLATQYHLGTLLDSEELSRRMLRTQEEVDADIFRHAPKIFCARLSESYLKRFLSELARLHRDGETAANFPRLIDEIRRAGRA